MIYFSILSVPKLTYSTQTILGWLVCNPLPKKIEFQSNRSITNSCVELLLPPAAPPVGPIPPNSVAHKPVSVTQKSDLHRYLRSSNCLEKKTIIIDSEMIAS